MLYERHSPRDVPNSRFGRGPEALLVEPVVYGLRLQYGGRYLLGVFRFRRLGAGCGGLWLARREAGAGRRVVVPPWPLLPGLGHAGLPRGDARLPRQAHGGAPGLEHPRRVREEVVCVDQDERLAQLNRRHVYQRFEFFEARLVRIEVSGRRTALLGALLGHAPEGAHYLVRPAHEEAVRELGHGRLGHLGGLVVDGELLRKGEGPLAGRSDLGHLTLVSGVAQQERRLQRVLHIGGGGGLGLKFVRAEVVRIREVLVKDLDHGVLAYCALKGRRDASRRRPQDDRLRGALRGGRAPIFFARRFTLLTPQQHANA
mmetsp:Transcript_69607/g.194551  ORF Transcript_69607/g.194551 Transcript_69607/m.194551 type:complete len:315 (-) Transcript_69607:80-1024(-)